MPVKLNLEGHQFGRLIALYPIITANGRRKWFCKCACGQITQTTTNYLTGGHTTSCGCRKKEAAKENRHKNRGCYDLVQMDKSNWTEVNLAWAGGLFDGEGYIGSHGYKDKQPQMRLGMCDQDSVQRFFNIVGCGKICLYKRPAPEKTLFVWVLNKSLEVMEILDKLYPFLNQRRRNAADNVINWIKIGIQGRNNGTR